MIFPVLSFLFYLYSVPLSVVAQRNGTFPVGASLTAGDKAASWLSPSGDFAFGFQLIDGTDRFLLSIWYDKTPHKTIVWYPTDTEPVGPVASGSKLVLTAEDGLLLSNPEGGRLWKSSIDSGAVEFGVMNNTGNFVLKSRTSETLWQSFDHPTDTLLPGQVLKISQQLLSRLKENNFTRGRFQLRLLPDGNLVLNTINLPTKLAYAAYYISGTYDPANSSNSGEQLVYDNSGYLYILRRNGERFNLTTQGTVPTVDGYHRATLNFDGVFSQYFYSKAKKENGSWSSIWQQPDNICVRIGSELDSGACGFNNICSLQENGRPSCKCPRGFSLLDPNDEYGSCIPDNEVGCQDYREDLYEFEVRSNTNWPQGDYAKLSPSNEEDCQADCMSDCLCAAAIFGGVDCWKKRFPLSNGRYDLSEGGKAFIKVTKSGSFPSDANKDRKGKKDQDGLIVAGSVFLGGSVFLNFILVAAFCISFSLIYRKRLLKFQDGEPETNIRIFAYQQLVEATTNFKEELGRGAFGVVYKGMLKTGSALTPVAIKKLDRVVRDGCKEFETEVKAIGQTHHKNLVRLLGFCQEREQRLLVYEFLSNGTLADLLFGDIKPGWNQRVQIALGIARGLLYLHEECDTQIIHCDIKPQNILLDGYYNARISDFGLAKLLMINQTHTETGIRGTKGYVAPEWFRNSLVTSKVDVYSFGVLLLEIICCRRNVQVEKGGEDFTLLTDWAYDCLRAGATSELVKDDLEAMSDLKVVERLLMVSMWCIQEDPSRRTSMRRINQMLEGVVQVNVPPNPSPFGSVIG